MFSTDMAYGDFEDLTRRRASDRILRDKAFNIAKNPKYCGYQHGLASMYKETYGEAATLANKSAIKNEDMSKKELVKKLHSYCKNYWECWSFWYAIDKQI